MRTTARWLLLVFLPLLGACSSPSGTGQLPPPVSPTNHRWFPLAPGTTHEFGTITCESCHLASAQSFTEFQCISCHKHPTALTKRLHLGVADFAATGGSSAGCYQCHPTGEKGPFSHTGIIGSCAECHQVDSAFAALPKPGFTHRAINSDCGACHQDVTDWADATAGGTDAFDPNNNLIIVSKQPTWVGPSIVSVTDDRQVIPMKMNHRTDAVDAGVLAECSNCHAQADLGQYYPGVLHWSLLTLGVPQPSACLTCHADASPTGFVGPLDSRRTPASGEMRHDVEWPTTSTPTRVATMGCQVCHQPPANVIDATGTFARGRGDGGIALFHDSLTAAGRPQPTACLDCHANTRPVVAVVTAARAFDHSIALGECSTCHRSTSQWSGGQFHTASAPTPATCLPCHAGDRPTSTAGWLGTFLTSPFDYGTNVNGVTHGSDQDCAVCHGGPGTGVWGTNQNWRSGLFNHTATSVAATTCIDCHTTQRPDLLAPPADAGYDHAASGTGDCFACHQATVTRGAYVNLRPIPGGDWRGGQAYPADRLISTPGQSVRLQSTRLNRTGPLVTSMTTATANLPNAFLHTSAAIPAAVFPGSASAPDLMSCWHCHTSTGTTVTAFANGRFHASLTNYRATPAAAVTPLAQPSVCNDCHSGMRPPNVVSKTDAGTWLLPMDHSARFTGGSVVSVAAMDCGVCHSNPGFGPTQWSDGQFHSNLPPGASPSECVSCHYPLMSTAQADVTFPDAGLPSTFIMKHRSTLLTTQACATCHTGALGRSTATPTRATLWRPGAYHASLTAATQPATCLDCHAASAPPGATQSTTVYTLAEGATATNGRQWMNHAHPTVTSKDCAECHRADAKVSGSLWSPGTQFHARVPTGVSTCATCHGLTNGRSSAPGSNNNLPGALISTATLTTSSASPANTFDQISHNDLNVTRVDCNFCHTQVGPSTAVGVQGSEWTKAVFHRSFTSANPMAVNGTTARCSNCHLNVRPGPTYTRQAHAAFTASSTQDCASCHSWPGTNPTTPNWLGATGAHSATGSTATSTLDCNTCHGMGGNSSKHLLVAAGSHYGGIANGNKCTSCHVNYAGFKDTIANLKYAHTNATANSTGCVTCHVFAGSLYTTLTNTPGLTRPTTTGGHQFSQTTSVTGSNGSCGATGPNGCFTSIHSNAGLARCSSCHQYAATTATTNVWTFRHQPSNTGVTNSRTTTVGCTLCH